MTTSTESPPSSPRPPRKRPGPTRGRVPALIAFAGAAMSAGAQVTVDAVATPMGGSTRYAITIGNAGPVDLALVTLTDAPPGDPLIAPSLVAPAGFLSSYDSGLGFIDFLGDTASFGAGSILGGFLFDSLAGPGSGFTSFTALDALGASFSGSIRVTPGAAVVPEPGTTLAGVGILGCLAWHGLRRRSRPC